MELSRRGGAEIEGNFAKHDVNAVLRIKDEDGSQPAECSEGDQSLVQNLPIKTEKPDLTSQCANGELITIKTELGDELNVAIIDDVTIKSEVDDFTINSETEEDATTIKAEPDDESPKHEGSRRKRVPYTALQSIELERKYKKTHFIGFAERSQLAGKLNLTERQIKIWFQNRRAKDKRMIEADQKPLGWGKRWDNRKRNSAGNSIASEIGIEDPGNNGRVTVKSKSGDADGVPCVNSDDKFRIKHVRNSLKYRRKRTSFSTEQLTALQEKFRDKKYVSFTERSEIADDLSLTHVQVQVWFQNRRTRWAKVKEGQSSQAVRLEM